jgi:calcineurin-like phosphoesterase family protein
MDMEIIRRWNERVKPEDTVYHLGDFCFKKRGEKDFNYYRKQLNGQLILLKGNHDSNTGSDAKITFASLNIGGIDWHLEHMPTYSVKYNLCGHVHNLWKINYRGDHICYNVGVDVHNFYPIEINEILKDLNRKPYM